MLIREFHVPREKRVMMLDYIKLMIEWNDSIQIISDMDIEYIVGRHIRDCIIATKFFPEGWNSLVDIGSGNGLPGIIFSILYPDRQVALIERDKRKAAFLRYVVASVLRNNYIGVIDEDAGQVTIPKVDIVTSRAMGSIEETLPYVNNFVEENTTAVFFKTTKIQWEIDNALRKWSFDYTICQWPGEDFFNHVLLQNIKWRRRMPRC